MKKDKIRVYALEIIISIILFFTLFVSSTYMRTILAIILFAYMLLVRKFLYKRNILSMYNKQATIMIGAFGVVYILAFYITGLYFGYREALVKFSGLTLLLIIIPTTVIIVTSEIVRSIFLAEKSIFSKILTLIFMVLIDVTLYTNIGQLTTFGDYFNVISFTVLSSIAFNLLWNYTSIRFGYKPIIIFRLLTVLYEFIIPIVPNVFMFFRCFFRIIYPYIIYLILTNSYSKNNFVIAVQDKKREYIITAILMVVMISIIMLISCEFRFGMLVIGSESMTGTINKGDAVVFESYSNQHVKENQIIIFNRDDIKVVHRVIDIKEVNGEKRYYTKGDANLQSDSGFVTDKDIVGVYKFKIKYIGHPTLALRELF